MISVSAALLAGCTKRPDKGTPHVRKYQLSGTVKRLYRERQTALIQHDKIDDWMEPMTMEFPVRQEAEFEKLVEDTEIRATVNVQDLDYWLTDIRTLRR